MKRHISCILTCILVLTCMCGCDTDLTAPTQAHKESQNRPTQAYNETQNVQLSDTCDYILCQGSDASGNVYQLVATQKETALGYEITAGIIKNNTWLVPMSSNSPFFGSDGLFPMEGGLDLGSVTRAGLVASYFYFIDSGSFAMKYVSETSWKQVMVVFNCNTMQSYVYYDDDYKWVYRSYKLKSGGSREEYDVISYGTILTDDGLILLYQDVSDPNEWSKPKKYDWIILDTKTMEMRTIASNVTGNYPECPLSEGLFYADDGCFYDTNAQKTIDLSMYDIDVWENGSLYFVYGECTFVAKNDLGTKFEITIDTSGQVLSEIKQ